MDSDPTAVISNIQRFSTEDGPGIRTTVFFKGCPLRCPWCHNPEGLSRRPQLVFRRTRCIGCGECREVCAIDAPLPGTSAECKVCGKCADACPALAREMIGRIVTPEELTEEVSRDKVFYGADGGVTASGGEASLYLEFLARFFDLCRERNIHVALDTSGAVPEDKFKELIRHADLILYDLKILTEELHREIIGAPLEAILANLRHVEESGIPLWVRFPVVPGYTDDAKNIDALAKTLKNMRNLQRIDLLPFHQLGRNKWADLGMEYKLEALDSPPETEIERIRDLLKESGLPVHSG